MDDYLFSEGKELVECEEDVFLAAGANAETQFVESKEETQEIAIFVTVKYVGDNVNGVIARDVASKEMRIVPFEVELSRSYPVQIKQALWNNFIKWS